jgi:hypothetical protein
MLNASGHLGDYFNGFLTKSCLTVNLTTFKFHFHLCKIQWETRMFFCERLEEVDDKRLYSK